MRVYIVKDSEDIVKIYDNLEKCEEFIAKFNSIYEYELNIIVKEVE